MQAEAKHYLTSETIASTVCNALLNLLGAYIIFHARTFIPTGGPTGLVRDLIGETFLAVSLSSLVPALILRYRRNHATLPTLAMNAVSSQLNPYLVALLIGILFTAILIPLASWLLPQAFPQGLSRSNVIIYKTLYGTLLGGIATFLTLRTALRSAA